MIYEKNISIKGKKQKYENENTLLISENSANSGNIRKQLNNLRMNYIGFRRDTGNEFRECWKEAG